MRYSVLFVAVILCLAGLTRAQSGGGDSAEDSPQPKESWWSGFSKRVKNVLSKWKDDIKLLWDEVLAKTDDMKGWTVEVFDSLKKKLKEWVETRPEVPDDEKNEIETFIQKLKIPTEKPESKPKQIDP